MAWLVASGDAAMLILVLTAFEAAALIWYRRRRGRGMVLWAFLPNMLAGDFLLLAWIFSAHGAGWRWSAVALLAALASHLADMVLRWE